MALLRLLVAAAVVCVCLGQVLPGYTKKYVGNINVNNVMDIEFLPNGYSIITSRAGLLLLADLYTNSVPPATTTYLDLSPFTFTNGALMHHICCFVCLASKPL